MSIDKPHSPALEELQVHRRRWKIPSRGTPIESGEVVYAVPCEMGRYDVYNEEGVYQGQFDERSLCPRPEDMAPFSRMWARFAEGAHELQPHQLVYAVPRNELIFDVYDEDGRFHGGFSENYFMPVN